DATEKAIIAQHFHDGEDNAQIAHYLAGAYIGTAETMELQTGDTADYFVSTGGFEINIHDKFNTTLGMNWQDAAAVLRALYELEQDGFSHGTYTAEPVTVYPGDKNNLPYDVVVERLHVEKPERPAPEPEKTPDEVLDEHAISIQVNGEWRTFPNAAAAEHGADEEYKANMRRHAHTSRISDDHLGEGGPKAKFQANINAIQLLKELEATGQQASPEQQQVLSRYVGWGGLPDAFDPSKESWSKE